MSKGTPSRWSRSLKGLLGSSTARAAGTLASGTSLAQLIVILAAPILTRLYSPSDFGAFAIFMSIALIVGSTATGRYEMAILLPKEEREATAIVVLALGISGAVGVIALLVVGGAYLFIPDVRSSELGAWTLLIPATVLATAWNSVFVAYATRIGEFRTIAVTAAVRQLIGTFVSVALGFLRIGVGGLALGGFAATGSGNLRLGKLTLDGWSSTKPKREDVFLSARKHSRFPKHTLPASLLNQGAQNGTNLLIAWIFGSATLGVYSLTERLAALPSTVIGSAVTQAYYRSASTLRGDANRAKRLYDRTVLLLAGLSAVPAVALGIVAPKAFALVFGPEWEAGGEYLRILLPWLWVRFCVSPVSPTAYVYERNYFGLIVQALAVASIVASAAWVVAFNGSFTMFLAIVSILGTATHLFSFFLYRRAISHVAS